MEDNAVADDMDGILVPEVSMDLDETVILNEPEAENVEEKCEDKNDVLEIHSVDEAPAKKEPKEEAAKPVKENGVMTPSPNGTDTDEEADLPDVPADESATVPSELNEEEMSLRDKLYGPGKAAVQFTRVHCTACNEHMGSAPNRKDRYVHPLLKVLICKKCYEFYCSGDFEKDEDGSELFCRWCGQGGKVLCCADCPYVFCQKCIRNNLGKRKLNKVKESDDWICFACNSDQLIALRVACRALYEFTQSEIKSSAEHDLTVTLDMDNSMCCHNKPPKPPAPKRKRKENDDYSYDPVLGDDINPFKKKRPLYTFAPKAPQNHFVISAGPNELLPIFSQEEEDEVVCTPDLSMLMGEEEVQEIPEAPAPLLYQNLTSLPGRAIVYPKFSMPPPPPPPTIHFQKDPDVQFVSKQFVNSNMMGGNMYLPSTSTTPAQFPNEPIILNTHLNRPLTAKTFSQTQHSIPLQRNVPATSVLTIAQKSNSDSSPTLLMPGVRQEWFDKATSLTSQVNSNLGTHLQDLEKKQSCATTLKALAAVHNELQEILSSSINTLIQVRKNLRSEFVNSIKKLKFTSNAGSGISMPSQECASSSNDDVIFVDSSSSPPDARNVARPVTGGGFLKVKSLAEINNPSSIITISDDGEVQEVNNVGHSGNLVVEEQKDGANDDDLPQLDGSLNPETIYLIKQAILESKLEKLSNDNWKYIANMTDIPEELLRKMLAVRVSVQSNFGPGTPRTSPRRNYKPLTIHREPDDDFEAMLSSSIIVNTSKCNTYKDNFMNFVNNGSADVVMDSSSSSEQDDDCEVVEEVDMLGGGEEESRVQETVDFKGDEMVNDLQTTDSGIEVDGKSGNTPESEGQNEVDGDLEEDTIVVNGDSELSRDSCVSLGDAESSSTD